MIKLLGYLKFSFSYLGRIDILKGFILKKFSASILNKKVPSIVSIIVALALFNIGSMGITQGILEDELVNTLFFVVVLVSGLGVLIFGFKNFFGNIKKNSSMKD